MISKLSEMGEKLFEVRLDSFDIYNTTQKIIVSATVWSLLNRFSKFSKHSKTPKGAH